MDFEEAEFFEDFEDFFEPNLPKPILAVIGRPNVGKSTLVNRIIGSREAVVEDKPGVTRDRVIYPTSWAGFDFDLMDTGGWDNKAQGLEKEVTNAAAIAVETADVLLFVVDATIDATSTDEALVKLIRKSGKPTLLVANKVDGQNQEIVAASLWNLGLGEPHMVSALHGRGSGDLLDEAVKLLKNVDLTDRVANESQTRRVALIGRPNVGKSSLLNKLASQERVVVSDIAGTTRDPVDELIEFGGKTWKFVDTAGIRRKGDKSSGAEYYSLLRTASAIAKAEVCLCLIDASDEVSVADLNVINMAIEAGRAVVLVFNKWDQLSEKNDLDGKRELLELQIEKDLNFVSWAIRVNLSALTGWHKDKLVNALETALESWDQRIPTATVNAFLGSLQSEHPHPLRGGKQPRILFGSQVSTRPPKFVLFTSGFLEHQYRRFIERRLREEFGFISTPIEISVRVREKHKERR